MESFQEVNRITINSSDLRKFEICNEDPEFDEFKSMLYPFRPPAGSVIREERRKLQKNAEDEFAEVTFYQNDKYLFSVTIYTFLNPPFPKDVNHPNILRNIVFKVDEFYAVAMVNNTNMFGNFDIDDWNEIELKMNP